jgi:hypothetical protein
MTEENKELKIGAKMADGTVYAGVSPDTNEPFYAMPEDAEVMMSFNEAAAYALKLNGEKARGHDDWRLPSQNELYELHLNCEKGALKGTFNMKASLSGDDWYISSRLVDGGLVMGRRLSDGEPEVLIRDVPGKGYRFVRG